MKKIITMVSLAAVVGCVMGVVFYLQKQRAPRGELVSSSQLQLDVRELGNPSLKETLTAKVPDDREDKTATKSRSLGPSKEQSVELKKGSGEASQKIEIAQPEPEKQAMEVAEPVIELAATNKDAALVASEFIDVLQQAAQGRMLKLSSRSWTKSLSLQSAPTFLNALWPTRTAAPNCAATPTKHSRELDLRSPWHVSWIRCLPPTKGEMMKGPWNL